jgi:hypothetical protein
MKTTALLAIGLAGLVLSGCYGGYYHDRYYDGRYYGDRDRYYGHRYSDQDRDPGRDDYRDYRDRY